MPLVTYNTYTGFFAEPAVAPVTPPTHGLVLVQEWWGLNEQMKGLAQRFADRGLLCVVPDLYHDKVAANADEAKHLMSGLDWEQALKEVSAAAAYLRQQGCTKVAITGFCMGGAVSAASAVRCADAFDGAAPFYGLPGSALCDLAETKMPIQAHFGLRDQHKGFSDKATADAYEVKLKKSGVSYTIHWYDADHAFMNEKRPEVYDPDSAQLAFERAVEFVKQL
ncbi:carboxymethylenebutenolidase [Thamnocephalis sphaerospora]|uniref:Carboxymethylenebutenolidase n=1 Tax=Thamnocephalis sphaerospora TaxID=78915 RepID=A0A4P9XH22_9FUNG|nr:carboxymethylenebutenolidase [Thamnocephalis sphaerospora]|eukprot:RKP04953.1 carboxymethylenebutenolidase [Thamnocephalis sphaerospora]